ncbi:MAG: 50S ribosomal protein L23 [Alphaproteobacteria bacterium]|nr:50S ribosomal protein L23 [Alphaproteobacteria bacterium]
MAIAARHYDTILAPVITEKSTLMAEENKVVFYVPLSANKKEIKEAVEALYNTQVVSVNTVKLHGKTKRFRGILGKRNDQKKAIVKLAEGQSIDVTNGV